MDGFEKYVGVVFDSRYKIEKLIGIGGMAVVYKANDLLMHRVVAVKILRDEIAADEQSVKRFINESRAVAMLSHPNIVNIFDVSVREDVKYIVMEYVEGITLKNYMTRRGALPFEQIVSYTEQILNALEHAHAKGIVHRDIKPQNIMLLKNGQIKVMDFGIAKLPNAETVTMTDKAIGTVYYISPEQASGLPIDARSDLYSLGVLMYEMACGQLPFDAESPVSVALMQVNTEPTPPRELNPELPLGLEQIIMKAMEKEQEDRYQTSALMLKQVQKIKENRNIIFRELKKKKAKKEKDGKPHRASHSMLPIILGVFFALLLSFGISGVILLNRFLFNPPSENAETITIEKFVGAYYTEELAQWFEKSEIYTLTLTTEYDQTADKGKIIAQNPKEGDRRKVVANTKKCEIELVVSKGPQTVVLPDLVMYDNRQAKSLCEDLGLTVKIEQVTSDTFESGRVIRTEPAAGTSMRIASDKISGTAQIPGETVTIYVSVGRAAGTVSVPNFVGLTEIQTLQKLVNCGLRVGTVTYDASDYPTGQVIYQTVEPSTTVHANTAIDFIVSGGPYYNGGTPSTPTIPTTPTTPTGPTGPTRPEETMPPEEDTTAPEDLPTPSVPGEEEETFPPSIPPVEIPPWLMPEDFEEWFKHFYG